MMRSDDDEVDMRLIYLRLIYLTDAGAKEAEDDMLYRCGGEGGWG